jgi:hypothetical protein
MPGFRWATPGVRFTRTILCGARFLRLLPVLLILAGGMGGSMLASETISIDVFVPSCRAVAPSLRIRDVEFNHDELLATWQIEPILNTDGSVRRHG